MDERKGPKNNKRKWGDALFVQAARALEVQKGHHGTPVYSDDILANNSPARQPLRLLGKCRLSVHADLCKVHTALKRLPAQGLTLAVYQLGRSGGPAAFLPSEATASRMESATITKTDEIGTIIRPLMCVVAEGEGGGKNNEGFDVLEKFLASHDQVCLVTLRTIETPTCQNNQTSTFKREADEVLMLYSSTSTAVKEFLGQTDEEFVIGAKHLRAAFVFCPTSAGQAL